MRKLTNIEFISRANNVHDNFYDYSLMKYINIKTKIKIICSKHGLFEQIPNNHLNGMGCPICGRLLNDKHKKKNIDEFIIKAIKIHGDRYDYSKSIYVGADKKIDIICSIHGVFSQIVSSHLNGRGCSKCVGGVRKTLTDFINDAKQIHSDKYDYSLVKYKNAKTKIKIICPTHGIFEQTPTKHLCGNGCFICSESKGEREVAKYLINNSILFEREKRFNECKNIKKLAFDFYLPNNNVLIEFDGRQHYEIVNFCNSRKQAVNAYHRLKKNDKIKNNFAKTNKYHLLRIKFDEINDISNILETYEPISQRQYI